MTTMNVDHKQIVERLYEAYRAGDQSVFDELIADDYVQHNPQAPNGLEATKALFAVFGPLELKVHRILLDGDLVAVHVHYTSLGKAAVDLFRFGADGKLAEHWDVLQDVPATSVSGNDMFQQVT